MVEDEQKGPETGKDTREHEAREARKARKGQRVKTQGQKRATPSYLTRPAKSPEATEATKMPAKGASQGRFLRPRLL